jgi:hypothetical protein
VIEGVQGEFHGNRIGVRATTLPKSADPLYGVRMDVPSSRSKLPDTPAKRVLSRVVPLDYPD